DGARPGDQVPSRRRLRAGDLRGPRVPARGGDTDGRGGRRGRPASPWRSPGQRGGISRAEPALRGVSARRHLRGQLDLSVHTYQNSTPGGPVAKTYFANAKRAVQLARPGTVVLDQYMPQRYVEGLFGKQEAVESTVIGDLEQGKLGGKFRWVGTAEGTIDGMYMFGPDGKLYPAVIAGVYSVHRSGPGFKACWPERKGRVAVRFRSRTDVYDWMLHLEYIWGSSAGPVTLWYGGVRHELALQPGTHNGYLGVFGNVTHFKVVGLGRRHLCVTGAEAGQLVAYGSPIP